MNKKNVRFKKGCCAALLFCLLLLYTGCGSNLRTDSNFDNANRVKQQFIASADAASLDEASGDASGEAQAKASGSDRANASGNAQAKTSDAAQDSAEETSDSSKNKEQKKDDTAAAQKKSTKSDSQDKQKSSSADDETTARSKKSNAKNSKKTAKKEKDSSTKDVAMSTETQTNPYIQESDGTAKEQDAYQTDPVPQGQQLPVEPQDVTVDTDTALTCSITVDCKTVLSRMDKLKKGKESVIPEDGILYQNEKAVFYEGESVFDVLVRELKTQGIHYEFTYTPGYNSDYVEGIGNLYERDCGSLSGWTYLVNGWSPNYGCSRYIVNQGDVIQWRYTCDLGKDLNDVSKN